MDEGKIYSYLGEKNFPVFLIRMTAKEDVDEIESFRHHFVKWVVRLVICKTRLTRSD